MMKKGKRILIGLIAICAACVISVASCSQSPQISNKPTFHTAYFGVAVDPPPGAITSGRARSLVAAMVGLISVIIGGLTLARNGRAGAIVALALGLIGMVLSVVHLGMSTGGFGTGSGRAGAIVALVLGLIGMNLGGLALARSRRSRTI
ncbi:MAG TPA: DUF6223 family protein [Pyrinomonadaceae bacterium]|nr:DUF6223 family protein [Pyrinomonadaceae bacterium]